MIGPVIFLVLSSTLQVFGDFPYAALGEPFETYGLPPIAKVLPETSEEVPVLPKIPPPPKLSPIKRVLERFPVVYDSAPPSHPTPPPVFPYDETVPIQEVEVHIHHVLKKIPPPPVLDHIHAVVAPAVPVHHKEIIPIRKIPAPPVLEDAPIVPKHLDVVQEAPTTLWVIPPPPVLDEIPVHTFPLMNNHRIVETPRVVIPTPPTLEVPRRQVAILPYVKETHVLRMIPSPPQLEPLKTPIPVIHIALMPKRISVPKLPVQELFPYAPEVNPHIEYGVPEEFRL